MTRVFLSPLLLHYRQSIADLSSECIKGRYLAGVDVWDGSEPVLAQEDLLPPPQIEAMNLEIYEGHVHDLLLFVVSTVFGLSTVRVMIQDTYGVVIESGNAFVCADYPDLWNYFTKAPVPSGTSVTVHVIATDSVGGAGARSEAKTIP